MTVVRAPETDPFDPAAERQDQPRPGRSSPGGAAGLADWLKWAWRQLTSMRIALILLFLLALASVPGSMLPQQGSNPSGVLQYYAHLPAGGLGADAAAAGPAPPGPAAQVRRVRHRAAPAGRGRGGGAGAGRPR